MEHPSFFDLLATLNQKCFQTQEEIRKQLQLSPSEYRAICSMGSTEKTSCKQLSQRMKLSISRGSRVVDKLYEKGCIERMDCQDDRRFKTIWLTKKGRVIRRRIQEGLRECEKRLFTPHPAKELEELKKGIDRLLKKT